MLKTMSLSYTVILTVQSAANQVYTVEQPPPYPGVMGTAGSSELGPPPAYVAPPPAYVTPNSGTAYAHASAPDQPATNRDNNQVRNK